MNIIQKVLVKQVLTEKSKEKLAEQFITQKKLLEQECQQLLFEERKLLNKKGISKQEVSRRFKHEVEIRQERIKRINYQLNQLELLPLGSEITEEEVESLVEVNVGDDWGKLAEERVILIKDGIVIQIK